MLAKSDFGIGKAILKAIGKGLGKNLGPEYEPMVWAGLALLFVGGFMLLVFLAARAENRKSASKEAATSKPVK
jgi:hypothetical protein